MPDISLDLILLVILGLFAFAGFWFGFLHSVGALIGTIVGAFAAAYWYEFAAKLLLGRFDLQENTATVLGFILTFIIVSRLFGVGVWLLEKFINISGIIPFFGMMNRSAGAVVGLVEGLLVVGLALTFSTHFPLTQQWRPYVEESAVAASTMTGAKILWPIVQRKMEFIEFIPEQLQK